MPIRDFDGQYIHYDRRKTKKPAIVPVHKFIFEHFGLQRFRMPGTLLKNSRGESWITNGFQSSFYRATKKIGLGDLIIHGFRHFLVSTLKNNVDDQAITRLTGHNSGKMLIPITKPLQIE